MSEEKEFGCMPNSLDLPALEAGGEDVSCIADVLLHWTTDENLQKYGDIELFC